MIEAVSGGRTAGHSLPVRAAACLFFALVLALLSCGVAAPAHAEVVELPPPTDCDRFPLEADGTRRQTFDAYDASSGIAAMPPRTVTELQPGERATFCIGFQNRGVDPLTLELEVADVAADEEGLPSSQREADDRGASGWVKLPTTRIADLSSGDVAWLDVEVRVPEDALPGSSYASVVATDATPFPEDDAPKVQAIPSVASQLFFNIPGDAVRNGEIRNIRSPGVIWWDGVGLGDLPVLERLRGLGVGTIRFSWRNSGDFTSEVRGRLHIRSDLGAKVVTSIPVPDTVVLARSERDFEATWKNEIPMIGRFTPVLEVTGDNGRVERFELDPIWVIPAWWYLATLALAIALPIVIRQRSKRRYHSLLERVEAAEARSNQGAAEDWDDASDEWR